MHGNKTKGTFQSTTTDRYRSNRARAKILILGNDVEPPVGSSTTN